MKNRGNLSLCMLGLATMMIAGQRTLAQQKKPTILFNMGGGARLLRVRSK
jgi:hypothetical protein